MLLSFESGSKITAQIHDAENGATVGESFTIDVTDHSFQAFKDYPDGSVAYPAKGATNTSIRVARIMPCAP